MAYFLVFGKEVLWDQMGCLEIREGVTVSATFVSDVCILHFSSPFTLSLNITLLYRL